jgi:hypothetical protein
MIGLAGLVAATAIAAGWMALSHGGVRKGARALREEAPPSASAASAATSTEPGDVRDQVSLMQAQLNGLLAERAQEGALRPAPAAASSAPADPAQEHAEADRRLRERVERVETDFQAELRDSKWSRAASSEFQTAVARNGLLQSAFQNIDCRSSTCRVEMLDDRSPDFRKQLQLLIRDIGPSLPIMTGHRETRADGTEVAIYYWSKNSG